MRKKAWERAETRGFVTQIATRLGKRPQTVRRWMLPPDHKDRRAVESQADARVLARAFDLLPNDFVWLPGERAERRRLQQQQRRAA